MVAYVAVIDAFIRHTLLIFFTKIKGNNSCLKQKFTSVKLSDVKMYETKYLVYAFTEIWSLVWAYYWRKFDCRPDFYVNIDINW